MFVLCEAVDYEGESVLGLYSSIDAAIAGAQSYVLRGQRDDRSEGYCSDHYDDLCVYEVVVDAASFWGRDPVWSLRVARSFEAAE